MLAASLIVLAAAAAYRHSFRGPFVYDDLSAIVTNSTIRQLWPIWPVLSPPREGETVSGRPLLNLSLAVNYAISGLEVWSYHAANLLIHITAALLVFGIVRRTLLTPALGDRLGRAATALALASAMLWAVHPLQTESVTYISQRAESLAGLFYLLTLYCVIRGAGTVPFFAAPKAFLPDSVAGEKGDCPPRHAPSPARSPLSLRERVRVRVARATAISALTPTLSQREREMLWHPPRPWYAAAVLACLLGMACKEVMVTAPLLVVLYDRFFLAGSFAGALRRRWPLYLGLAATWGLLVHLVLSTGLIGRRAEMGAIDVWGYARTQPAVVLHYLRLAVWPRPLCFDYAWPVAHTLGEILPGAIVIGLLAAATMLGFIRGKAWGFLGAWFFLILAPTSSILPLGQLAFEHRMYLPLAAVAVLAVTGGYALWDWAVPRSARRERHFPFSPRMAPAVLWATVAVALGCATAERNEDYRSAVAIWQDTVDKRPDSYIAQDSLGAALAAVGRTDAAVEHFQRALRLKPDDPITHHNLGLALVAMDRCGEAIDHYRQALRLKDDFADAHANLANALERLGNIKEAVEHYDEALRWAPDSVTTVNNLAWLLATNEPERGGDPARAIQLAQRAIQLSGEENAGCLDTLAAAYAAAGRFPQAVVTAQRALQLAEWAGHTPTADLIRARLERYRAGRPYREAPRSAAPDHRH